MYYIWTKDDEYSGWSKVDCPDEGKALAAVLFLVKQGKSPVLTQEVPFEVGIKVQEVQSGEIAQSEAKPDQSAGAAGNGAVRRGDPETT